MSTTRKRWILSVGGLAVVAIVLLSVFVLVPRDAASTSSASAAGKTPQQTEAPLGATEVAERFLAALSAQRFQAAADLTDAPPAAVALLTKVGSALRPQSVQATASALTAPAAGSTEVSETFTLSWKFASSQVWAYSNTLSVVTVDGRWRVKWSPAVIHPKLTEGTQLAVLVSATEPNAVVDRDGKPLLTWQGATARPVDPAVAPLLAGALQRTVTPQADSGGTRIALVDAAGKEVESLFGTPSAPVEPMKSTLSLRTQAAAQAAVDSAAGPAYLVAIQPSTGGILAVAQNSAAGDRPDALNGLYPPGSTFKVVTAAAVLDAGQATVDTVLPCPGTQTIGTRSIKNADFELGPVPLRTAFAESCNTTFAALAAELPPDSLSRAAAQFGLAADFEIPGLTTQTGRVRPATGTPQQVENSIGQGTVQVSPFGLALMTATVAKGSAVTPKLFTGVETVVKTGYRGPSSATVTALRAMMREVVRSGRGDALRGHGAVAGKTGTAQFGDGTQAHGWFAGYRGDLAFAVLVADAGAAAPAVTVTGKFLAAVK